MEWIVEIENEKNKRIKITFNPLDEIIIFSGEFKPKNQPWIIFSKISSKMNIELDQILILISDIEKLLTKRIEVYNNLDEGFHKIKSIQITKTSDN